MYLPVDIRSDVLFRGTITEHYLPELAMVGINSRNCRGVTDMDSVGPNAYDRSIFLM
jgi:hypothetical protein